MTRKQLIQEYKDVLTKPVSSFTDEDVVKLNEVQQLGLTDQEIDELIGGE